jgi:hypothetical protein
MKGIQFHKDFLSQNCSRNSNIGDTHMAATLGAGVQDGEILDAMKHNNAIAVTGTSMVELSCLTILVNSAYFSP